MINRIAISFITTAILCAAPVNNYAKGTRTNIDVKVDTVNTKPAKKTFWQKIKKPIKWFGKQWSAYDPRYSTPSFYNWVGQIQNKFSKEWLNMKYNDGMEVNMHSRLSSKFGPYLGYSFLGYGYSIDFGAIKGTKGKSETGLDINSNLMNIQLIYRHTGGDFQMSKMTASQIDMNTGTSVQTDVTDLANQRDVGERIKYSVIGANFNIFLNHKKYSNPAAFSNGAIQLKSVGSPIVGFGIQRQKITNTIGQLLENGVLTSMFNTIEAKNPEGLHNLGMEFNKQMGLINEDGTLKENAITDVASLQNFMANLRDNGETTTYKAIVKGVLNYPALQPLIFGDGKTSVGMMNYITNQIPTEMIVDDYHLQLGYAYNLVFSKRLLLGMSVIASPGIKHVKMNNNGNLTNIAAEEFADAINSYYSQVTGTTITQATPESFRMNVNRTQFGYDFFARASLTYNYNRWRVGVNASANSYIYKSNDASMRNIYGNANVYVGYCFGRKKQYRWNGKNRQAYVMAALSSKQIAEMHDTLPESNINEGVALASNSKKTKYKTDNVNFGVYGCDLVKGPDGTYGSFVIEDGLVTPGQDGEGKLKAGTVIPVNKDGSIKINCGHEKSFRAANWWKSQLTVRQIPTNWYPEMLHYALKGKLTFWIRSYKLGSKEPIKLVLDNFCINHGQETSQFIQIASQNFYSHSAYSIIGNVNINGRLTRIYIESKHNGKTNNIYVCPLKQSDRNWMGNVPDDRAIARMSIPATHDAGTASLPEGKLTSMGHTQNLTIAEQLEDGIRAFDIRLKENMKFGHTMECRDGLPETMEEIREFLKAHPTEFIVAMIGSDEGGKWSNEMKVNYANLMNQYTDLIVDNFNARTPLKDVRGKILVIKRQDECPFGKLLQFQDNTVFENNGFCVEDVYKEHKTYKKIKIVEKHIRDAHECLDPDKWYITFNSIAWDPRHHKPYYSAWGAVNVRKPMNPSLREIIELKNYTNFGMVFLDFYNDHCDRPQLVEAIIKSNFNTVLEKDFIPAE